jgi:two-component system chemotaxis sensor kinase CheA
MDAPAPAPAPAAAPAAPAAARSAGDAKPGGKGAPAETPQAQQYLRVSVSNLDTLMNLAGELVLSRNQLIQAASADDPEESGETVDSIAARIDRITSELQEAIMQTRMQPVGSVFNKFPRIVRDLATKLGKDIELDIHGKEVELDKSIIEAIGDPLTHLIRNACDHGVETPDKRTAAGKSGQGTVVLKAFHQAGKVFITIEDDGNGIDPARMRIKAVEKGIMGEDAAAELSDIEAQNLIFNAGFSTAEQVTDVSGRGVGMDVVRTNIEMLGGMIEIDSKVGRGSKFQIQLPLTLAIIPSLVIFNDGNRYAIPQTNISELIRVKPEDIPDRIGRINEAEVLRLRGDLLPLIDLVDVVNDGRSVDEYAAARSVTRVEAPSAANTEGASDHADAPPPKAAPAPAAADHPADHAGADPDHDAASPADARPAADALEPDTAEASAPAPAPAAAAGEMSEAAAAQGLQPSSLAGARRAVNIIVVEAGTLRYGLVVDEVADSQEIVVKPLGRHMKSCQILAGATVLGDGQVALILDLTGVAVEGRLNKKAERVQSEQHEDGENAGEVEKQSSLLFTNHDEEIFAVPTALISRIERVAASEIENLGGRDILQYGGKALPLMSLEHHVNAQPRPEQDHYHVVVFSFGGSDLGLIAPRLVDIRGISTEIDQNTFVEPGVIGSVVEQDRSIRILDVVTLGRTAFPDRFEDASPMASPSGTTVILLAEDSNFFRRQVISFLESDGYEVVGCEDGQVAWQVLQDPNRRFDMVLTDIEMPNMNGYELTRTIRADPMFAHLPIIALSSLSSDEDIKKAKNAGVNAYQIKMDREALLREIRGEIKAAAERAGLGAVGSPMGVPA